MLNISDLKINDIVQANGTAIMITSLRVVVPKGSESDDETSDNETSVVNDLPIETIEDIELTDSLLDSLFTREGEDWIVDKNVFIQGPSKWGYTVNFNDESYTTLRELLNAICSDMVFFGNEKDLRLGILLTINNTK
jgi:hypothetical protein